MGIVSKPNTFSADTTISSSKVNDNFDTLYNDYNGGISAANLATDSVTTAKIADSNVTTAKIADSNVTTAKLASGAVTNAKLATTTGEIGAAWQSYTPTWTNLTVGNGTVDAKYTQIGKTVRYRISVTFGSTTSISGSVTVTLPVTSVSLGTTSYFPIGIGAANDSGSFIYQLSHHWKTTTTAEVLYHNSGAYGGISSTSPFTWGTGDILMVKGSYEAA